MQRRTFTGLAAGALAACTRGMRMEAAAGARLSARPGEAPTPAEAGAHPLNLRKERDTILYVPKSADAAKPAPLVLYLHGATGSEQQGIRRYSALAEEF